jgi:hypothetical protein
MTAKLAEEPCQLWAEDKLQDKLTAMRVRGGVYPLYLHSFAFKYRYILYSHGGCWARATGRQASAVL